MIDKDRLKVEAAKFGVKLGEDELEKFSRYAEFLKEYNEKVNLTAITDDEGILIKHFLDSILLSVSVKRVEGRTADVGSGAGFPGVPFAIVNRDVDLTAIEPNNKRVEFLHKLSEEINVSFSAVHIRAEEAARQEAYRERFALVTARAVKEMRELCELCLPLVSVGGVFAALKGPDIAEEIKGADKAIRLLGGKLYRVDEYGLPDGSKRNIVLIKKISQVSTKYPRIYAKIKKNPL